MTKFGPYTHVKECFTCKFIDFSEFLLFYVATSGFRSIARSLMWILVAMYKIFNQPEQLKKLFVPFNLDIELVFRFIGIWVSVWALQFRYKKYIILIMSWCLEGYGVGFFYRWDDNIFWLDYDYCISVFYIASSGELLMLLSSGARTVSGVSAIKYLSRLLISIMWPQLRFLTSKN